MWSEIIRVISKKKIVTQALVLGLQCTCRSSLISEKKRKVFTKTSVIEMNLGSPKTNQATSYQRRIGC